MIQDTDVFARLDLFIVHVFLSTLLVLELGKIIVRKFKRPRS